jgi:hypothetical protein
VFLFIYLIFFSSFSDTWGENGTPSAPAATSQPQLLPLLLHPDDPEEDGDSSSSPSGSSLAMLEANGGYDERTPDVASIVRPST